MHRFSHAPASFLFIPRDYGHIVLNMWPRIALNCHLDNDEQDLEFESDSNRHAEELAEEYMYLAEEL